MGKSAGTEPYLTWYSTLDQLAQSLGDNLVNVTEPAFEEFLLTSIQLLEEEMLAVEMPAEQVEHFLSRFRVVARAAWQRSEEEQKVPEGPKLPNSLL